MHIFISRRRRRLGDGRYGCIFSKLCRYVHQVMGVCCIVFDIDGMLFEFFMNFLNIHVFFALHAISKIKKKLV